MTEERKRALYRTLQDVKKLYRVTDREARRQWRDLFDNHCPSEDFKWEDDGYVEDVGTPWHCGDSDCEAGWHVLIRCQNIGRRNGEEYVEEMVSSYSDGDWELEGEYIWPDIVDYNYFCADSRTDGHFRGWAEYWLDCAETGKDPLSACNKPVDDWEEFCLDAAEDSLRYFMMGKKQEGKEYKVSELDSGKEYMACVIYPDGKDNVISVNATTFRECSFRGSEYLLASDCVDVDFERCSFAGGLVREESDA